MVVSIRGVVLPCRHPSGGPLGEGDAGSSGMMNDETVRASGAGHSRPRSRRFRRDIGRSNVLLRDARPLLAASCRLWWTASTLLRPSQECERNKLSCNKRFGALTAVAAMLVSSLALFVTTAPIASARHDSGERLFGRQRCRFPTSRSRSPGRRRRLRELPTREA